jgi:hypothetical protein
MITSTIESIPKRWKDYLVKVKKPTRYKSFIRFSLQLGSGNCQKITGNLWVYNNNSYSRHEWK